MPVLELYTFRMSHFSEKIRWSLDAAGIEYREICWTPFFHVLPALRHGRIGTTVPILRHGGGYVQDSTRILMWLDHNMPGFNLLPRDADRRRQVLELEARFDRVGAHVIRYAYSGILNDAEAVTRLWTLDANPVQTRVIRSAFPLLRAVFRRKFGFDPTRVARSRQAIAEMLDVLETHLADGREFLVGDSLSVADITACALLAPLVGPDQHEVYSREDFRAALAPRVSDWLQRPAAQWLRRRYQTRHEVPA